jgi:hypothetical protein
VHKNFVYRLMKFMRSLLCKNDAIPSTLFLFCISLESTIDMSRYKIKVILNQKKRRKYRIHLSHCDLKSSNLHWCQCDSAILQRSIPYNINTIIIQHHLRRPSTYSDHSSPMFLLRLCANSIVQVLPVPDWQSMSIQPCY